MPSPTEYILGTTEDEYARLLFQHRLWSDFAIQTWRDAAIAPGQTILDLGCGPGHATFELATLTGGASAGASGGRVYAVDESETFINRLRTQAAARGATNITSAVADAHNLGPVGIAAGSLDLVYTRWMLCFVRDPEGVVRGVSTLLKPGGRLAVNDYFNYESMTLAPRRASFTRGIKAIAESWRSRGGDPDVVGRLPRDCAKFGMQTTILKVEQRIARPHETMWQWGDSFWRIYIPRLVAGGFLSQPHADEFFDDWRAAAKDENSFIHLPTMYELVALKA